MVAARRWPLIAFLTLLPIVCWIWIVFLARDMVGPMTGASAWMMTPEWDPPHLALLWSMWAVMMTGMMVPSAAPMILMAGRGQGYFVALGYVAAWAAFSVAATLLQWALVRVSIVTSMMEVSNARAAAVLLALAGIYQLSPLKRVCLTTCQSPMAFFARRWRNGSWGGVVMGLEHGAYCVGCCWALMLLLFAGGVMNLVVILALTVFVAFEKLVPLGRWSTTVSGVGLLGMALWAVI